MLLLSIRSEFATKIFDGSKRFEFRKRRCQALIGSTVLLYEVAPASAITGYFTIADISYIDKTTTATLQLSADELFDLKRYLGDYEGTVSALHVEQPRRLTEPISLDVLGIRPPQSYLHLTPEELPNGILRGLNDRC